MISKFVLLLPLFAAVASQAQSINATRITCSASGKIAGISRTVIQNSDLSGQLCAQSMLGLSSDGTTKAACSNDSIDSSKIFLFGQFELGFGTTEYYLEKTGSSYSIAQYLKCDLYHGESECPYVDQEFHFTGRDLDVKCTAE